MACYMKLLVVGAGMLAVSQGVTLPNVNVKSSMTTAVTTKAPEKVKVCPCDFLCPLNHTMELTLSCFDLELLKSAIERNEEPLIDYSIGVPRGGLVVGYKIELSWYVRYMLEMNGLDLELGARLAPFLNSSVEGETAQAKSDIYNGTLSLAEAIDLLEAILRYRLYTSHAVFNLIVNRKTLMGYVCFTNLTRVQRTAILALILAVRTYGQVLPIIHEAVYGRWDLVGQHLATAYPRFYKFGNKFQIALASDNGDTSC